MDLARTPLALARCPLKAVGLAGRGAAAPAPAPPAWSGTVAGGYEPVAELFGSVLEGVTRGGALCVRRGDEVLVDIHAGWADPRGERAFTPDTPALSFSTTKGVTATAVHVLVDRGLLALDEPVATWWPEFAANGKSRTTLLDVLTHRAGLWDVRSLARRAKDVLDADAMEERLAAAKPSLLGGAPGYHAYTFGWLCGGLIRRVTGLSVADAVQELVAGPLGLDGLSVGRPARGPRPAETVGSSLRLYGQAEWLITPVWGVVPVTRPTVRSLLLPGLGDLVYGRDAPIWTTQMPAVNGAFTARGLAGMYAALAHGGAGLMRPETVLAAGRVQARERDRVLGLPMGWRAGYHHAFTEGAPARQAFGHYGYGGSGGWADPESGLSFGYVTNDIGAVTSPVGDRALFRLSGAVRRCADAERGVAAVAA